ncbi:deoxyhypusine synthase [Candidatus Woesearchaeota archaeon]|jgi:deoxyhypusine synthase|nr:deoxyhypusine synthase [Candidatus Woesearchaeota archaeon]MBT5272306.1 deoxyhypusine synthase [Candidatus Woesearchaeota archaeon]MBT6040635.1 deoxyhypusine synthase [Candidatus Woesearchaeota archaeon]MBT6336578.1 deoxyhypusine synthase [Candidatus Woesearchaeota archaeon]MBT7927468.1 deoxyhypusine synthase [Candidatus Woesearchaeota archaeon]
MTDKKLHYHIKKNADLSKFPKIEGYNFNENFDFKEFLKAFSTSGIQAANLGTAIEITKTMIREKTPIFLSFTSNMISSGMREIIAFLAKEKKVAILCTSAGGVEEDAIKAHMPFHVGDFEAPGATLFESGVGRIGNIYVTNEHYSYFEPFIREVFKRLLEEQKTNSNKPITPTMISSMMGKLIGEKEEYNEQNSYLYWAYKNSIPVFCPGIIDGAIGDIAYYFKKSHPNFVIDVVSDHEKIIDYTMNCEKTAAIALGGGIAKHYILNANIFKDGLDYAVYISTAMPFDASDSGGNQEEAITWAKVKPNALRVKVYCDASIAFPLLVAGSFI